MIVNWRKVLFFAFISSYTDIWVVDAVMCYECSVQPPLYRTNDTISDPINRVCSRFNESEYFQVECPYSTFCTKKIFQLTLPGGKTVVTHERGCAYQKYTYHVYKEGKWVEDWAIEKSVYQDGCFPASSFDLKVSNTTICYCSSDFCNTGKPSTEASFFHHTDTMAVIFIFNVVRFLKSTQ